MNARDSRTTFGVADDGLDRADQQLTIGCGVVREESLIESLDAEYISPGFQSIDE